MLKLISLFFISIFAISCGGEVGVVYHNNATSGTTNGSGNSNGTTTTPKPVTPRITCLPGADCNIRQPSTNIQSSNTCLPGVECTPTNIKVDTGTDTKPDTKPGTSTDTKTPDTNTSNKNKNSQCLPGQTSC